MPYDIQIVPSALDELQSVRRFYQRQVADAIDEQLQHEPTNSTRHRKPLEVSEASFDFDPPLWELRVGDYRVFYDVDDQSKTVYVRAVREKPPHSLTEDVL